MAASNVNVVVVTGNLTRDPELRSTGGGTSVCEMRVAVNSRRRNGQTGEWEDKPNFFDVVVFGAQADNCATYLHKGRPLAVEGRLDWREWEAKDNKGKRQAVQIIANTVQFLGSRDGGGAPKDGGEAQPGSTSAGTPEDRRWTPDPQPVGTGTAQEQEEDIPF
jgi:single-strand DNA-binding protein